MDEGSSSRRRRGAGVVTANACTECRKKRSKCNGQIPCSRCAAVKAECVYEIPIRQSKETMRAEIESLQNHRQQSERVLAAISTGLRAQETLNRIRNGENLDTIAEWLEQSAARALGSSTRTTTYSSDATNVAFGQTLRMAESAGNNPFSGPSEAPEEQAGQTGWSPWPSDISYPPSAQSYGALSEDVMSWTADGASQHHASSTSPAPSRPLVGGWSRRPSDQEALQSARDRGQQKILGAAPARRPPSQAGSPSVTWTAVTQDIRLVEHFMALYFCWEYPTFASLSKERFVADFRDRRPRYCSALLVNAMLALGCRFSNLPESRADPSTNTTSGDHYFAEAVRLLAEDDRTSLTTIQAIVLMSIREASFGRDTDSFYYAGQAIRLAVEAGLHMGAGQRSDCPPSEEEGVRAATFWGAFALDQAWSLTVGRIPHFSRSLTVIDKPLIIDAVESSEWVPYTDEGVPSIMSASQPSNIRSVCKCFCELSELVHQSLYTLYAPGRRLTSSGLLIVYTRYLNWYSSLPEALRLGHNFTPAVLFAHMYYHYAILLLFRPFIKLRFIGSRVSPRDVCCQAADAIITLVGSYDQLYTLQRTPSFVPYMVCASCIVHLVRLSNTSSALDALRQGEKDLREMSVCHGFARRARSIVSYLAEQWFPGVSLADEGSISAEEAKESCEPSSMSLNFFCPDMGHLARADSSPLFCPFPMQGLPLLSNEEEMERDGFAKIS